MFCSCFFLDRGLARAFIFAFARYCRWTALSLRDAIKNEEAQLGQSLVFTFRLPRVQYSVTMQIFGGSTLAPKKALRLSCRKSLICNHKEGNGKAHWHYTHRERGVLCVHMRWREKRFRRNEAAMEKIDSGSLTHLSSFFMDRVMSMDFLLTILMAKIRPL